MRTVLSVGCCLFTLSICRAENPWPELKPAETTQPLPGTALLEMEGDISRQLVDANDTFLDQQIEATAKARSEKWKPGSFAPEERREELREMLGMDRDARVEDEFSEWRDCWNGHGHGEAASRRGHDHCCRNRSDEPRTARRQSHTDAGCAPQELARRPSAPLEGEASRSLVDLSDS